MPTPKEIILKQIDDVLKQYGDYSPRDDSHDEEDKRSMTAEAISRLKGVIDRVAPSKSLRENAEALVKQYGITNPYCVKFLVGMVRGLRADYAAGYLHTVESLVQADLFADFLEMAEHLLSQGYKDAAAVIIGSVLEEHLRKLSAKHMPTEPGAAPKKADAINAELGGAQAYSKLDQQNVTAWLALRNRAAHGKYAEYTKEQVELLLQSVRDFITRNPA
jgi:hypothetical protein